MLSFSCMKKRHVVIDMSFTPTAHAKISHGYGWCGHTFTSAAGCMSWTALTFFRAYHCEKKDRLCIVDFKAEDPKSDHH
jgi:hypothetical protein